MKLSLTFQTSSLFIFLSFRHYNKMFTVIAVASNPNNLLETHVSVGNMTYLDQLRSEVVDVCSFETILWPLFIIQIKAVPVLIKA